MASPSIQSLQSDIQKLQSQVAGLSATVNNVTAPTIPSSRDKLNQSNISSDQIIDVVWNKYFYYYTPFEADQGWDLQDSSSGSLSGAYYGGLQLSTGAISGNASSILKTAPYSGSLSFDCESRFRTSIFLSSLSNETVYITIGQAGLGVEQHYGFKIVNNILYGIVGTGTNDVSVVLETLVTNQIIQLDARFVPKKGVTFYCSNPGDTHMSNRGIITTLLPSGAIGTWIQYLLVTNTTSRKDLNIQFTEYIQVRPNQY